jgi:uncharacterized protein
MRFVFDTNTIVSAILKPSSSAMQAMNIALQKGFIIFSTETKAEISDVIQRNKFDVYIPLNMRLKFLEDILGSAIHIETKTNDPIQCRDHTDIKFLRLAFEAKADVIISGDTDLKVLNPFRGIPILSIGEFITFVTMI